MVHMDAAAAIEKDDDVTIIRAEVVDILTGAVVRLLLEGRCLSKQAGQVPLVAFSASELHVFASVSRGAREGWRHRREPKQGRRRHPQARTGDREPPRESGVMANGITSGLRKRHPRVQFAVPARGRLRPATRCEFAHQSGRYACRADPPSARADLHRSRRASPGTRGTR